MRRWLSAFCCLAVLWPSFAFGQAAVLQGGNYVGGHVPIYSNPTFGQPIVTDGGAASGGGPGVGLSELNITARGNGTGPYAGQGTGPLGTLACMQDNPSSTANYHYLCFSPNAQGGGLLAYGAAGTASQLPLAFNINGQAYQFPFSIQGIVGPSSSVINDVACWNNTVGTLLKDCGGTIQLSGSVSGTTTLSAASAASGVLLLPNGSDTLIGKATVDTLTNKTFDTAGTGNVLRIAGTQITAVTGTGSAVLSASPTLTGVPLAPTAAPLTSTTQVATTAFARTAVAGTVIKIQKFIANGTYTPDPNLIYAIIECWGGGGGGGGTGTTAANIATGGGGGGAGSYSLKVASAAAVAPSQTVTIGAAGAGATSGGNQGVSGGDTSVGTLCIGKGGTGGLGSSGSAGAAGGPGGIAGTGDITGTGMTGGAGGLFTSANAIGGQGGSASPVGAGGTSPVTNSGATGNAATGFASGGSAGATNNNSGPEPGGSGTVGLVKITEYTSQ